VPVTYRGAPAGWRRAGRSGAPDRLAEVSAVGAVQGQNCCRPGVGVGIHPRGAASVFQRPEHRHRPGNLTGAATEGSSQRRFKSVRFCTLSAMTPRGRPDGSTRRSSPPVRAATSTPCQEVRPAADPQDGAVTADLCSSRHQMAGANVVSASASTIRRTWPKETVRAAANRRKWLAMVALKDDQGRRSTQQTVNSLVNCKSGGYIA
jgi:hypothetical protein